MIPKLSDLSSEQKRVLCAELAGWKLIESGWCAPGDCHGSTLPNFLHDLNACHELEKTLSEEQQEEYGYQFLQIVEKEWRSTVGKHGFQVAHATAAQRTDAILVATGRATL
jgi:hypothetical protein